MLPALSHHVTGQLAPLALAATRSWRCSSWLTRSYAGWCCVGTHGLMPHQAVASSAGECYRCMFKGSDASGAAVLVGPHVHSLTSHPQKMTGATLLPHPSAEAAGSTIQEVTSAQEYESLMKHLAGNSLSCCAQAQGASCPPAAVGAHQATCTLVV